ncbi:MAG TPA: alpha/beta fold hydrolase [Dermatophilaceae bacterium]|nr:alpha/beta fold hydrolase [Dermatophilaceae bacterium]
MTSWRRPRRDGDVAMVSPRGSPHLSREVTRRGVLAGAVALPWLVACGPGASRQARPDLQGGTLSSRFWPGQQVHWRLARPAVRATPQPLVIALHGQGGDADWPFDGLQLERHVTATGLALATVDGGDFYWHARRSGIDTSRMVVEDLLPLLGRKGLSTDRIGLIGWSMGGYGALLMASRLGPARVAGVVAASAALWQSYDEAFSVAFDDRADFARHDVFAARPALARLPVRLDCGRDDLFFEANRAFARGLRSAAVTFDPGGHTEDYWTTHAAAQLTWLGKHLR